MSIHLRKKMSSATLLRIYFGPDDADDTIRYEVYGIRPKAQGRMSNA